MIKETFLKKKKHLKIYLKNQIMITSYLIVIGCSLVVSTIVSILWVQAIDHMKENYPDYKGEDLFGNDLD
jgi:hypothetical protein